MRTYGASVTPSPSMETEVGRKILEAHPGTSGSLGCAISEAVEVALGSEGYRYVLGRVLTVSYTHLDVYKRQSIFKTPVLYAFGASDATIGYGEDYIAIYLLGTIFVQLSVGLNTFISGQGSALTAMLSVLIGAVINIVLDPIFIFLFGMGVKGAALATILSQAVSAAWVLRFLTSQKSVIRLRKRYLKFHGPVEMCIRDRCWYSHRHGWSRSGSVDLAQRCIRNRYQIFRGADRC